MAAAGWGNVQHEAERLRILELLEQRKITAAEASELLGALDLAGRTAIRGERGRRADTLPPERPRAFRVRVTDAASGRVRANVSVPVGVVGFGLDVARKLTRGRGSDQIDDIVEAVRSGRRGTVFDISGSDGERVEIVVE